MFLPGYNKVNKKRCSYTNPTKQQRFTHKTDRQTTSLNVHSGWMYVKMLHGLFIVFSCPFIHRSFTAGVLTVETKLLWKIVGSYVFSWIVYIPSILMKGDWDDKSCWTKKIACSWQCSTLCACMVADTWKSSNIKCPLQCRLSGIPFPLFLYLIHSNQINVLEIKRIS